MARPKGVIQARNESKYVLPEGVTLAPGQQERYTKETKLKFIDSVYGEYTSQFRAIIEAGVSTHPKAVQARREATNRAKYGGPNPSSSRQVREKAEQTNLSRYGVKHALLSSQFIEKSMETSRANHGVNNAMHSKAVQKKMIDSVIKTYGASNVMHNEEVKRKLVETCMARYGLPNGGGTPESIEKMFQTFEANGGKGQMGSKEEQEVRSYVSSLGFVCSQGYLGGKEPKQIDVKIEGSNICIELDGCFWHNEYRKASNYHIRKTILAEEKGLRLIHIYDTEWHTKRKQIESYLRSALGKNSRKIGARKTEIREVNKYEAVDFLNEYHILGSCKFKVAYGLYVDDELLSMITISRHHRKGDKELTLNRFVGKFDVNVIGGLSKLCNHAVSIHGPITTWVDKRWSNGDNWVKSGWAVLDVLKPDYSYYDLKNHRMVSKQSRQKKKINTPNGMTEHEHAKLDGLARVYDCGKIKLIYK